MGVAECAAARLPYAGVGLEDDGPLLAVAVVRNSDAPQGVALLHRVEESRDCRADRPGGGGSGVECERNGRDGRDGARAGNDPELAENDHGGDEGGDRTRGAEPGTAVASAPSELRDQGGANAECEVSPRQPAEGGEQMRPERVRDRGAQRLGDLRTSGHVARKGPSDGDGQGGGDAGQSGNEHCERAEPMGDLASGRHVGGRHGHPSEVMPLMSVADSVTVIWRLETPMIPRSWVGWR